MTQNAVFDAQRTSAPRMTVGLAPLAVDPRVRAADPVGALAQAVQRPAAWGPGGHTRRPFDAQYWACWVVAVLFPTVVAYLLLTR